MKCINFIASLMTIWMVVSAEDKKTDKRGLSDFGHGFDLQYNQAPQILTNTVPVPKPYPVHIQKNIPYPVQIPVDKPYPVHIPKPYPVHVDKPVPYKVDRPIPYPVKVPYKVPVYQRVEVPVPKPYPVPVDKPYPVHVPQPYIVEKKIPIYIRSGGNDHGSHSSEQFNSYAGHGFENFDQGDYSHDFKTESFEREYPHYHY